MDKVREEFEVWFEADSMPLESNWFKKDDNDDYDHMPTYYAWRAWQASRSALCVELPAVDYVKGVHYDFVGYDADLVKDALANVGVSYK